MPFVRLACTGKHYIASRPDSVPEVPPLKCVSRDELSLNVLLLLSSSEKRSLEVTTTSTSGTHHCSREHYMYPFHYFAVGFTSVLPPKNLMLLLSYSIFFFLLLNSATVQFADHIFISLTRATVFVFLNQSFILHVLS